MELLNEYILPIVALGVFIIIEILKRTIDFDRRYIPVLSALLGVFFTQWHNGFDLSFQTFLLGVVSGGSGTWLYELGDNLMKPKEVPIEEYQGVE